MKLLASIATLALAALSATAADVVQLAIKSGAGPGGQTYTGTVDLSPRGAAIAMHWKLNTGDAYPGIAVAHRKFLGAAYGGGETFGVSVIKIEEDGTLNSIWTTSDDKAGRLGKEKLTGGRDLAGDYAVEGTMPDGKSKYTGVVSFRQTGRTYEVLWKNKDGSTAFIGVGLKGREYMVVGWNKSGKVGVVAYTMDNDGKTVNGVWAAAGSTELGTEKLAAPKEGFSFKIAGPADEVKRIADSLRGNKEALMKLKPTAAQIAEIAANEEDAKALAAYTEQLFASIPAKGIDGKPGQTETLVTSGDSLPGGYAQQAAHFKKGVAIYGFKYVMPGETSGMAFDGLVKLGETWVMIPKAWRAFAK
jgi:hypothetical protein